MISARARQKEAPYGGSTFYPPRSSCRKRTAVHATAPEKSMEKTTPSRCEASRGASRTPPPSRGEAKPYSFGRADDDALVKDADVRLRHLVGSLCEKSELSASEESDACFSRRCGNAVSARRGGKASAVSRGLIGEEFQSETENIVEVVIKLQLDAAKQV